MRRPNPCLNCEKRVLYCHSRCEKEADYKAEYKKEQESIRKERQERNDYVSFQIERREHARRTHHKPK